MSVILSTGTTPPGQTPSPGRHPLPPSPQRRPLQRTVCILLECILVTEPALLKIKKRVAFQNPYPPLPPTVSCFTTDTFLMLNEPFSLRNDNRLVLMYECMRTLFTDIIFPTYCVILTALISFVFKAMQTSSSHRVWNTRHWGQRKGFGRCSDYLLLQFSQKLLFVCCWIDAQNIMEAATFIEVVRIWIFSVPPNFWINDLFWSVSKTKLLKWTERTKNTLQECKTICRSVRSECCSCKVRKCSRRKYLCR